MKYDIKKLKKTKDLPKLIKLLSYKKDAAIRANAAAALGNLRDKRGIEPLIGALEDKDWTVQRNSSKALGEFGEEALKALLKALCTMNSNIIHVRAALKMIGKPAVKPLIEMLKDKDWQIRDKARETLGIMGKAAVMPLIKLLDDKNFILRENAILALAGIGDKRSINYLIRALSSEDKWIRLNAALGLGNMEDKRALKPLIYALKHDRCCFVRESAAKALGNIGDREATEYLIAVLDSDVPNVGKSAEKALEEIRKKSKDIVIIKERKPEDKDIELI